MANTARASRNKDAPLVRAAIVTACAQIVDALPVPCALFDADGACLAANAPFRSEFARLGAQPSLARFEAAFEPATGSGPAQPRRMRGGRGRYLLGGRRLEAPLPGCTLAFATTLDRDSEALREHKARQEQLLATSRMMSVGEMTTTLAHELNQPLAAIINYLGACAQMLEGGDTGNPRLAQGVALARGQAVHASEVVTRLREFVRTREPRRAPHRADALVRTVLELVQADAEQQQIAITTDVPADLPAVFADRVMIEQVLMNLVKNAIDAMREVPAARRRLHIAVDIDLDGRLRFRILDRGCGLGDDGAAQLFTPLYTTKPDGLGMGLAICRSIIEYHAGRLYAEPNPDGGSVFVFTLPLAEADAGQPT